MKLFGISNHGLASIGLLVITLWGVILMEHSLNRQAEEDFEALRKVWPALNEQPEKPAPVAIGEHPLELS